MISSQHEFIFVFCSKESLPFRHLMLCVCHFLGNCYSEVLPCPFSDDSKICYHKPKTCTHIDSENIFYIQGKHLIYFKHEIIPLQQNAVRNKLSVMKETASSVVDCVILRGSVIKVIS